MNRRLGRRESQVLLQLTRLRSRECGRLPERRRNCFGSAKSKRQNRNVKTETSTCDRYACSIVWRLGKWLHSRSPRERQFCAAGSPQDPPQHPTGGSCVSRFLTIIRLLTIERSKVRPKGRASSCCHRIERPLDDKPVATRTYDPRCFAGGPPTEKSRREAQNTHRTQQSGHR